MSMVENIIPILNVLSLARSLDFYQDVLGFKKDWSMEGFGCVSRDGSQLFLAQGGQGQAGTWLWVGVHDVNRMYADCIEKGATIRSEMVDNPWAREFAVADPDGHVLRFGGETEAEDA